MHQAVIKLWIFLQNLENPLLFQYLKPEYQAIFRRGEEIESGNLNPSLTNIAIDFHKLNIQIEIQNFLWILPFWTTLECLNKMTHIFVHNSEKLISFDDSVRSDLLSEFYMQLDHIACEIINLEKEGFAFITDDRDTVYLNMEDILRGIVSSTSKEVEKQLRDGVFEIENYLKKSEHLNVMRKSGRDILSQNLTFKPIKRCRIESCQC